MDRVVVVGNCQAKALELTLCTNAAFAERFEPVSFPPVHEIPDAMVPELHRAVADATVVLAQRVDEGYREGVGLGTETLARIAGTATFVRWPSVYWAGYVPDLFYLRDADGQPVVDGPFDYHDRTILASYAAGEGVQRTCELLSDPDRPSTAPAWAASATAELGVRGQGCDIDVASFIDARFRDELLFFTMNHPANRMLAFIAQQVIELLGIPGTVDASRLPGEVLGSTFYPLHGCHVRALGLSFADDVSAGAVPFRIRGVEHAAADAVQQFFGYYDAHPDLVELNCAARADGVPS